MTIILAPDKFKNSLTGLEFCEAVETVLHSQKPNIEVIKLPLADGGDGTIEVVNYYLKGDTVKLKVNNPFFKPVDASYLFAQSSKTAFIEMAEASGVKRLKAEELDCVNATTFGTGEMILDAINKGAKNIILGIGGSATNDCGIGMASALGYKFLDDNGEVVKPIGKNLSQISTIDTREVVSNLHEVKFNIACDVSNPLYGKEGAAHVYAKQKGATELEIDLLDTGLKAFSKVIYENFKVDPQQVKGAGAAGGMGIASKVFLNGQLKPGIDLVKDLADFDAKIENANWIITGEGSLDKQTFSGKTITGVVASAKEKNIKVAVFCGVSSLNQSEIESLGIHHVDAVVKHSNSLKDAMKNSYKYVKKMTENFISQL